ncbi:VOC family protein, partial [Arthrobacter deserti]|nr:VOC family protein [Arthrobacter deserti]
TEAEEAAEFYTSVFDNSRILEVTRYGPDGPGPEGRVITVSFELVGREYVALNGGPQSAFTEAVSFQVPCTSQDEVDKYWTALSDGGEEGRCGWVKDRFGLSWQVMPTVLPELLGGQDTARSQRAMQAMLQMKKLDIAALQRAYDGA